MSNISTKNGKSFVPSSSLKKMLEEKLRLENKRKKNEIGEEELRQELNKWSRRKVDVIDRHIFQSMADLTYFFEFCKKHNNILDDFENDIEELFGFKGPHMTSAKDDKLEFNIFDRFIDAIINTGNPKDFTKFRVYLINIIAYNMFKKIRGSSYLDDNFKDNELFINVIVPDLGRAHSWIKYLLKKKVDEPPSTREAHRYFPYWIK